MILFELLIALSLMGAILLFLLTFSAESAKREKKLETARSAITARHHLQTRLQSLFLQLNTSFYTQRFPSEKKESLALLFNHGIDPDPRFSGLVVGRVFLDEEHNFCLALWPLEKEHAKSWRKEILFPAVADYEFEFFGRRLALDLGQLAGAQKLKERPINEEFAWKSSWSKQEGAPPSLIRLKLWRRGEEPLLFCFFLPSSEVEISYDQPLRAAADPKRA